MRELESEIEFPVNFVIHQSTSSGNSVVIVVGLARIISQSGRQSCRQKSTSGRRKEIASIDTFYFCFFRVLSHSRCALCQEGIQHSTHPEYISSRCRRTVVLYEKPLKFKVQNKRLFYNTSQYFRYRTIHKQLGPSTRILCTPGSARGGEERKQKEGEKEEEGKPYIILWQKYRSNCKNSPFVRNGSHPPIASFATYLIPTKSSSASHIQGIFPNVTAASCRRGACGPGAFIKLSGGLHHLVSHSFTQPTSQPYSGKQPARQPAAGNSPHLHSYRNNNNNFIANQGQLNILKTPPLS